MNNIILYPDILMKFVIKDHYIPRKIRFNEHLKIYKRYWIENQEEYLKVDQIYDVKNTEYYSVKYSNYRYGVISHPLDCNYTYELMSDRNNIRKLKDIIGTEISYTGAEIRFWFFINNIDLNSEKYNGFLSYIDPNSLSLISDNKHYFVRASIDNNGNYYDCRVSLDKSKEKRRR